MAEAYYYSSTAPRMALAAPLTNTATTMSVDTVAGLPGARPFKLVLDPGLPGEEIVKVTDISGTTLTVVRGWDGTPAQSHGNLAEVRHMVTAEDLRLAREHESASDDVHGVLGKVVGTNDQQTLTNKDLSSSTNAFPAELARDVEVASAVASHAALTKSHGVNGVIVGTTDTQTLTNKTLSGASNTFSGIPKTAIGGLTGSMVDTDSEQTLTTKTLDGATNTFTNIPQSAVTNLATDLAALDTRLDAIEAVPAWTAMTGFGAGMSADAGSPPQWRVSNGRVELRGRINHSSTFSGSGTTILTLPAGAKPARDVNFPAARNFASANTGDAKVNVTTGGAIVLYTPAGETSWFSLDGIFYWTT